MSLSRLRSVLRLTALTLSLLQTPVAMAQSAPPAAAAATASPVAAPAPAVPGHPALWVVRDADTTIYLFGTVHVLHPGTDWFSGAIANAFNASDELVTELPQNADSAAGAEMLARGVAQDGVALTARLSAEQRQNYSRAMASVGLPVANFERFEPWMPAMMLSVLPLIRRGYSAQAGVDHMLQARAATAHKAMSALENVSMQLGVFDGLTLEDQIQFLDSVSKEALTVDDSMAPMTAAWLRGDVAALSSMIMAPSEGTPPELNEALLFHRNENWAQWADMRLNEPGGKFFVAVGAAHLAGPRGVPALLEAQGWTVTRVE